MMFPIPAVGLYIFKLLQNKLEQLSHEKIVRYGAILQILGFALLLVRVVISALAFSSVLIQHRCYLIGTMFIYVFYTLIGYVPPRWYNGVLAPVFYISWTAFHWKANFLHVTSASFGLVIVIFACYIHKILDDSEHRTFQAIAELDAERRFLERTQSTLHGMLSSMFLTPT